MLSCRATLDVSFQLVLFVSRPLASRRIEIGTGRGTGALACFGQAVFVLGAALPEGSAVPAGSG